ncbi:MAG: TRAP transporter substrate-binding protein [Candidatus Methylomirabilota bacterium]
MLRRGIGLSVAVGMLVLLFGVAAVEAAKVQFTLGTTNGAKDTSVLAMERWKEAMAKASGGELEMKIISGGALGSDKAHLEQLSTNEIQVHVAGPVVVHNLVREYQCLEAEFVFDDEAHGFRVWNGPLGQEVNRKLVEQFKIRMVGIGSRGARHLTANKPIREPADMKGVKIRVTNKLREEIFKAMGALPGPLAVSELYGALRQGVFDAQENPISTIYGNRFYEAQKFINLTGHVWSYWVVSASETFLRSLGESHRKIFLDTLKSEGIDYLNQVVPKREKELLDTMAASGKTQVISVNVKAFQQIAGPIVKEYAAKSCRPGLLEDIRKAAR